MSVKVCVNDDYYKNLLILIYFVSVSANNLLAQEFPRFKLAEREIANATPQQKADMQKALSIFEQIMNDRKL